jgi:hypothetical protein
MISAFQVFQGGPLSPRNSILVATTVATENGSCNWDHQAASALIAETKMSKTVYRNSVLGIVASGVATAPKPREATDEAPGHVSGFRLLRRRDLLSLTIVTWCFFSVRAGRGGPARPCRARAWRVGAAPRRLLDLNVLTTSL